MLRITNPATDELLKELISDTAESTDRKYILCRQAQRSWQDSPPENRASIIGKFAKLLDDSKEECAKITSQETGRPIKQVISEIEACEKRIEFFLDRFPKAIQTEKAFKDEDVEEFISWEPLGVIANISAWNYPYFVGLNVIIPALLTGNGIIYKPSEYAAMTGMKISELLNQAGLPENVLVPLIGDGKAGELLLAKDVEGVFFTGSYQTGRKIHQLTATKLIKTVLELGGKDPCYVTDESDMRSVAAAVADGAFYNCGQSCCSVERVYIHSNVYDSFVEEFVRIVKSFKIGSPENPDTYIGPLTRKAQIQTLKDQIDDALNQGADLLTGGNAIAGKGNYFEPTVLKNVNHDMKIMREESFGPIIGLQRVSSDQEAIELMNDTDFGLTASVYCQNQSRVRSILRQLNAGTVYANCCDRVSPYTPWSGRKSSGLGSTLGEIGIKTFLQPKAWHVK